MLNGFKTFSVGLALAVLPQLINYLSSVDFVKTFGLTPNAATLVGVAMIGLRAMTSTPIFKRA